MSGLRYMYPFPRGTRRSQGFAANPNNGVNPGGGHTGDDWAVPVGTPVYAAGDGVIELSSWVGANYLSNPWWLTQMGGDNLVLNCGDDEPTFIYCHLADSTATVGQRVRKGQVIGYSGNSGTATTGPHCHMEVLPPRWNVHNGTYGRVRPELYLSEYPGEITVQSAGAIETTTPEEDFMAGKIDAEQAEAIAARAATLVIDYLQKGLITIHPVQAESIVAATTERTTTKLSNGKIEAGQADDIARAAATYTAERLTA